jgi:predicted Zn finger-like uncharacterized protein
MPLSVTCPGCETVYPVGEALIGKTIRCKKCGEQIVVRTPGGAVTAARPARAAKVADDDGGDEDNFLLSNKSKPARGRVDDDDDAPRPAKRSSARVADDEDEDDYDDAPRKAKKGAPVALVASGAIALLVLAGGGVGAYFAFGGKGKDTDTVQANPANTHVTDPGSGQPMVSPGRHGPAATTGTESPAPSAVTPVKRGNAKPQPPAPADPPETDAAPPQTTKLTPQSTARQTTAPPADPTSLGMDNRDYMLGTLNPIVLAQVKKASVFFRVETDRVISEGSGWFGLEPSLVVTNAHVIEMKAPGSKEPKKITMFLNAGTPEQREIPHSRIKILAVDREIDLALLQIVGEKDLPVPLKVKPSAELVEGQGLKTIGYPFGSIPSQVSGRTKKEPEVSIRPTAFTAFRRNEFGQPRRIQLEGGSNPGNSGGPVVDANGMACAVIVESVHGGGGALAGISLTMAVPTEYVLGLLAGRISDVEYQMPYRQDGKVHIPVKVNCLDPLSRLNKVGIAGWVGDTSDKYRAPGPTRSKSEPGDADFQVKDLKITKTEAKIPVATGELVLPDLPPGRSYWVQPYYSNSNTPEYWTPGIKLPIKGPPVDRAPADLTAKFREGAKRSVTMSNSSVLSEHIEGEGEAKNERLTVTTTLKVTETVLRPDKNDYLARLRLHFEEIGLKADELGTIEYEAPKRLVKLLNDFAKLAEAIGFVNRNGEMFRYQVNTLGIQDPVGRTLVNVFGNDALEAFSATSIPLPNRQVNAGDKWETVKHMRLSLAFARVGRGGKAETQVKEYKYVDKVTYTYLGQRERAGKREAVIQVVGKVSPAPGSKEAATGELKGTALVELDSGVVVEAELESEFELDSSGDGLKKKVSGMHKYKVTRGASAQ